MTHLSKELAEIAIRMPVYKQREYFVLPNVVGFVLIFLLPIVGILGLLL